MRLIDADALKERVDNLGGKLYSPILFEEMVKNAPAVEAEPVKHAKWYAPASYDPCEWCSNCHERTRWFFDEGYCPNCGAKMDGGKT